MNCSIVGFFSISFLLLSGCSSEKKSSLPPSETIRLNLHTEPPTLDPRKATDVTSISVIKMCFEGLTRVGKDGKPELAAAEKVEVSTDGLRYLFQLKKGHWSDGNPVTAYDFEKSWKTMLNPEFPCEFAIDLYLLKNGEEAKLGKCSLEEVGVKALGSQTLQIDLTHPVPYFLAALSTHSFYPTPTHIVEKNGDWVSECYVGNGPFQRVSWKHHRLMEMSKNPHYWDAQNVRLEKIQLFLIEDTATELSMYENGQLDWAGNPLSNLPEDALPSLQTQEGFESFPVAGTYSYVFNVKAPPFDHPLMRKAFSLAIDREAIIDHITLGKQIPATGLIPCTMWDQQPLFQDKDVEKAKAFFEQALQEMALKKEELPKITLRYNTLSANHKIAQAIQQQWKELFGITVAIENREWKVFLDELRQGNFQIARMGGIAAINDPSVFLNYYRYPSSSLNYSQWENKEFSSLLAKADLVTDPIERTAILKRAEALFIDEMPIAPIYFYTGSYLKRPYVKEVYLSQLFDLDLKWAYIETEDERCK